MEKNMNDLAAQVREYTNELRSQRAALIEERTKLEDRRDHLLTAPLNESDFYDLVSDYIDSKARYFVEKSNVQRHQERLAYPCIDGGFKKTPINFTRAERIRAGDEYELSSSGDAGDIVFGGLGAAAFHTAMCFYFGDVIKEKLIQLLKAQGAPLKHGDAEKAGPCVADRRVELAQIDERVRALDNEVSSIDSELKSFNTPIG